MDATDLAFAGIARQAELIREGEVTPRELVEIYLERIERIDPRLGSLRAVYAERALAEADQALARHRAGADEATRPLLGVPILIKDDVDIAGEVTAYGSRAHDGRPAAADSEVVRRLREAGAIVLGKTNVPELMQWPFTESATFGICRNPWDLERSPGGSSGGSAAAVAAGLAGAALGTDGAGSIRIPAACCGLFGLKPQRGRVSYAPKTEGWAGLSVIGGLTRSVIDTARFLDVVTGSGPGNGASANGRGAGTYAEAALREPRPLRIACCAQTPLPNPVAREPRAAYEATIELLRSLGHEVEQVEMPYLGVIPQVVARYLRAIHDDVVELPHPERLERRTRGMARLGSLIAPPIWAKAREAEGAAVVRLNRVLANHDVLLTPALAQLPLPIGRYEGRGALYTFNGVARFTPYTAAWNVTGQPAAAVPAGFTDAGVPLSVQLVARPYDEATLLSLSAQLEAARPTADRRPPIAA